MDKSVVLYKIWRTANPAIRLELRVDNQGPLANTNIDRFMFMFCMQITQPKNLLLFPEQGASMRSEPKTDPLHVGKHSIYT